MAIIKRWWNNFLSFMGIKKNPKYVKDYLNETNMKSSIYMGAIVIILEIWLLIRQTNKYVKPYISDYHGFYDKFQFIYGVLFFYILFLLCGITLFIFAITFTKNKKRDSKKQFILNLVFGSICIFWFFMLFPVDDCKNLFPLSLSSANRVKNLKRYLTILEFIMMPIFGSLIISHTIYKHHKQKNNTILSICIIIAFAAICLIFGIRISYSDFCNPETGDPQRLKMITCFLTMVIFVACLLIWKPYISIIMLTTIFFVFKKMLDDYDNRTFVEGDYINYITFLVALIMVAVTIYHQRVEEASKDMKLEHDAKFDYLFEIYNVRYISNVIDQATITNPNFLDHKMYLFMNFKNFKIINAQDGFGAGDKFLINTALIANQVFKGDLVSRQSDDHFVLFVRTNNLEKKIETFKEKMDEIIGNYYVRLRIGGYRPKHGELPSRCIDKARYACKFNNDNYFNEYDDKMDEYYNKRQYIINHIDEAVEKGWVVPYYQPVVWAHTKDLSGAEALARWIDPVYGFLSPADFIPVLEETRLIHKLDMAIIEYVCREMKRAIDEGRSVVPVSINFSKLDFELFNVEEYLDNVIEKYQIDKDYIHIEITESTLSKDFDELNRILISLRNKGYSLWLDDFGSGYSSLNILKDIEVDVIKIDMKFLSNFETNSKTKDILDIIIKLCDKLHMKTLTEGVETKEEAEFLDRIGCGRLQGYLFGKPLALKDFEEKIKNQVLVVGDELF